MGYLAAFIVSSSHKDQKSVLELRLENVVQSAAIIRKSRTGESRGFGFVTYQSASDAQMVLVQEHSIGGRHIDAKQALPRGNSNPNRETRLFVGKLPPDLTDIELRDHFEKFGKVQVNFHAPRRFCQPTCHFLYMYALEL